MTIDQTRYQAFLRSMEMYRLKYLQNLVVPKDKVGYGLARGTAFHVIADEKYKGTQQAGIDAALIASVSDTRAISKAKAMHKAFECKYAASAQLVKVASEVEFRFQIEGSKHDMAGRIDEILSYKGQVWCGETKTVNAKADYAKLSYEWRRNPQADFEILGARSLGYQVEGVLVRTVTEHIPPRIWELEVTRSADQLKVLQYNVHQVCEQIEMMIATYGIDNPWPHNNSCYPCSMEDRCEYQEICGKPTSQVSKELRTQYVQRQEHLPIITAAKRV